MLPDALVWLRQSGSAICKFTAYCGGPIQDMLLAAMSSSSPQLKHVFLCDTAQAALSGLSAFKYLLCCHLIKPAQALSLYPLCHLPCLVQLSLQSGTFNRVAIPGCMTSLTINDSHVVCAQEACSVTHLQRLVIVPSEVSSLQDLGLLACTCLRHLELSECLVTAADPANQFAVRPQAPLCIPAQLSLLTKLSHLDVDLASSDVRDFDAGWLYKMASVESLVCTVHGTICLDKRLTQLSKLKNLHLQVTHYHDDWMIGYDNISWEALHHLSHISFAGPSTFDGSILGLTSVDQLKLVSVWDFHPTNDFTAKYLAILARRLAAHRPQVQFLFDKDVV